MILLYLKQFSRAGLFWYKHHYCGKRVSLIRKLLRIVSFFCLKRENNSFWFSPSCCVRIADLILHCTVGKVGKSVAIGRILNELGWLFTSWLDKSWITFLPLYKVNKILSKLKSQSQIKNKKMSPLKSDIYGDLLSNQLPAKKVWL